MEKIRINDMQAKGVVFIVKYQNDYKDGGFFGHGEATLNINFNSQEISYLENDVGIGGVVSVEIKENKGKNGQTYINITKVDFGSAVPSGQVLKEVQNGVRSLNGQEQLTVEAKQIFKQVKGAVANSDRNKSIIAQCLVKAVIGAMTAASVPISVKQAVNMYKEALKLLG